MLEIVAAADFAGAVSGEPERVYMPNWIGIKGFVKTSSTSCPAFMQARSKAGVRTPTMSVPASRSSATKYEPQCTAGNGTGRPLARLFSSKSEWIDPNGLLLCSATRPALGSES